MGEDTFRRIKRLVLRLSDQVLTGTNEFRLKAELRRPCKLDEVFLFFLTPETWKNSYHRLYQFLRVVTYPLPLPDRYFEPFLIAHTSS
jgi:hypothetical protein